jgi:Peptidase family S41
MTRLLRSGSILALVCSLVVGGCGSTAIPLSAQASPSSSIGPSALPAPTLTAGVPATVSPAPSLDRITGWRADIDGLLTARESVHPDPWHGMARTDWVAAADAVKAKIPDLTDDQALVELVRLAAMPDWKGRDGHTGIFLTPGSGIHAYPIRWWRFSDGLVITAARAPYEDLVGSRVTAIGGHPIEEVLRLVEPLAPRDNPSNLLAYGPLYSRVSELLSGLGVIDNAGPATFSLVGRDGKARNVTIEPISVEDDVAWNSQQPHRLPPTDAAWLRDQAKTLWWSYLDDSQTLFVQYNAVEPGIDPIADEILARAKQDDVSRVVVDLRHNGGGDNTTMGHFEDVLRDPAINRPGHLVVLIGRITFSAAANFATDLEQSSAATFAGEAMGGSPNLYGDAREIALPYGGQSVYVATRYWQRSTADDQRITIEPEIHADLSSADYFAGRDPVLQAVFDTPVAPG